MSVKIYHNPRCSKSRTTLSILEEKGLDVEIIKYLSQTPSAKEIKELLHALGMQPRELMRQHEAPYKENNLADESLSDDVLIQAMADDPILIERPIVKTDKGVVIGRPPENVLTII